MANDLQQEQFGDALLGSDLVYGFQVDTGVGKLVDYSQNEIAMLARKRQSKRKSFLSAGVALVLITGMIACSDCDMDGVTVSTGDGSSSALSRLSRLKSQKINCDKFLVRTTSNRTSHGLRTP